jgi:hypothetical protein
MVLRHGLLCPPRLSPPFLWAFSGVFPLPFWGQEVSFVLWPVGPPSAYPSLWAIAGVPHFRATSLLRATGQRATGLRAPLPLFIGYFVGFLRCPPAPP